MELVVSVNSTNKHRLARGGYMSGLDGLRILSLLGVIAYHMFPEAVRGGYLGVNIFFVVTGYLTTESLIRDIQRRDQFKIFQFWGKRISRLIPSLVFMMSCVVVYVLLFQRSMLLNLRGNFFSGFLMYNNWWQIAQGSSYFAKFSAPSPFTHLWFMAVEGQFYLIWAILVYICIYKLKNLLLLKGITLTTMVISMVAMISFYIPGADPTRVYYGTDTRIFTILMGSMIALYLPKEKLLKFPKGIWSLIINVVGILSLLSLLVLGLRLSPESRVVYEGGMIFVSVLASLLVIVCMIPGNIISNIFGIKLFRIFSKRSYTLYLWQYPIMILAEPLAYKFGISPWKSAILQIIVLVIISELAYRLIEIQFRNLRLPTKKRIAYGIREFKRAHPVHKAMMIGQKGLILFWGISLILGLVIAPKGSEKYQEELTAQIQEGQIKNKLLYQPRIQMLEIVPEIEDEEASEEKAASEEETKLRQRQELSQSLKATFIGDSVLLSVATKLQEKLPKMDYSGEIGMQFYNLGDTIQKLNNENKLHDVVVLIAGNNGAISQSSFDQIMAKLGDRKVFIVNVVVPKSWEASVNQTFAEAKGRYNNLEVIDWYSVGKGKEQYFWDGVHPNTEGSEVYANLIVNAILEKLIP